MDIESTPDPYPEHTKQAAIKDASQAIGEFLDFGLPKLGGGMAVYERVTYDCECSWCAKGAGSRSAWHTEDEKEAIVDGVVQVTAWQPTHRSIQRILADYFEIDLDKIEAEKRDMLDRLRKLNAAH